ncbi:MAG: T9SS type A sorting domain-containing protein [Candidatus Zixiibacteriota bacterium]|nr:MAG: T9SS type A sorting domain-containing protein [candidate division Zixibacteria bacterium]
MVRLLTILFLTLLSFTTAGAASFDVVYSVKSGGAENYAFIDPLVNAMDQHAGFIYSDRVNRQLIIHEFAVDTLITVGLSGAPEKTLHYYSRERDTLFVYALISQIGQQPKIALLTISDGATSMNVVRANCFNGLGNLEAIEYGNIRFHRNDAGVVEGVWLECSLRYLEESPGFGASAETHATTILYSLDLQQELWRDNVTSLHPGNLYGDEADDLFGFTNYHYQFDLGVEGGFSDREEFRLSTVLVADSMDYHFLERTTPRGNTRSVMVGDFDPSLENEEVIISGRVEDLEGLDDEVRPHLACYSFADESVTRLWYFDDSFFGLDHIYRDRGVIVGTSSPDRVVLLDYGTGLVIDSVDLGRELSNVTFFETYSNPSTLNLTGRVADTVFVYRFDIPLPVQTTGTDEAVPATFSLQQNYPNPFNGETRIAFDTEVSQYLALKIYNILGQEVTTLAEGIFSPGTYYAYWNGADYNGIMQSSGVYFAKLQADDASQIIKLIFLK